MELDVWVGWELCCFFYGLLEFVGVYSFSNFFICVFCEMLFFIMVYCLYKVVINVYGVIWVLIWDGLVCFWILIGVVYVKCDGFKVLFCVLNDLKDIVFGYEGCFCCCDFLF